MARIFALRAIALLVVGLLLAGSGCVPENRGEFTKDACVKAERVAVGGTAAVAVYFADDGTMVGTDAEDMGGTKSNQMCAAPPGVGTGQCNPGFCAVTIPQLGKTFCKRC